MFRSLGSVWSLWSRDSFGVAWEIFDRGNDQQASKEARRHFWFEIYVYYILYSTNQVWVNIRVTEHWQTLIFWNFANLNRLRSLRINNVLVHQNSLNTWQLGKMSFTRVMIMTIYCRWIELFQSLLFKSVGIAHISPSSRKVTGNALWKSMC